MNGKRLTYRADIDGLRAIAIAAVVIYHAFPNALPGGFTGVDIFFVISGYLISSLIWDGLDQSTFTFRGFYRRRVVRLFPALVAVLIATAIAGWIILPLSELSTLKRDILAAATFSSNIVYWRTANYFTAPAMTQPLTHLWSLAVEEQFYLIWPISLILFRKRFTGWALVGIFVTSFVANVLLIAHSTADFYLLPTRGWELAAGALVAWANLGLPMRIRQILGVIAVGLIVLAIVGPSSADPYPGWWALTPVGAAVCVIIAGPDAWFNRFLATRPMVSLGKVSYPLYLWHFPIFVFARILYPNLSTGWMLVLIGASLGLAYLTWFFLERPIQAWNRRPRSQPVPVLAAAMGIVASVGLILTTATAQPISTKARFTVQQLSSFVYKSNSWRAGQCFLNPNQGPSSFHGCVQGGTKPLLLLFGDSHAAQFTAPFTSDASKFGYRFAQFTASACPPVLGFGPSDRPSCASINKFVFAKIRSLHPSQVVLSGEWSAYPLSVTQQLPKTITQLRRDGVTNIVLIGNVPNWSTLLPVALYYYANAHDGKIPSRMTYDLLTNQGASDAALQKVVKATAVTFADPMPVLCDQNGCITRTGNTINEIVAFDWDHLTDAGATYVVNHLAKTIFGAATF